MPTPRLICFASCVVALIVTASGARADEDARLLAGSGSLNATANSRVLTLKGTLADDGKTTPICYWKRWRYANFGAVYPPVAFAPPVYYPPVDNYPPPAATVPPPPAPGPAAYYYPPRQGGASLAIAPRSSALIRPSIVVGYQGRIFSGSIVLRPGARAGVLTSPGLDRPDVPPAPRPDDTYRYDGGPSRPVPMPEPDPVAPTEPVPTTVPALHRVMMEQSRPKVAYPAYGDRPASKKVIGEPLMVKRLENR